jgi:flagellar hook-associated protein 1
MGSVTVGLSGAFHIATNAMAAQRAGMEVVGHNLANASVAGYSRQRLEFRTAQPIHTAIGQQGVGVIPFQIQQLRNSYIDGQIPTNLSKLSYNEEKSTLLSQVQADLNQPLDRSNPIASTFPTETGAGLAEAIDAFFNSWSTLATDPSNFVLRKQVVQHAQNVAGKLNDVGNRLDTTQQQITDNVQINVDEINDILGQIADLNANIASVEIANFTRANDMRDERQRKLEELSRKIDIFHQEEANGTVTVRLKSSTGDLLVSGTFSGNTSQAGTVKLGIEFTGSTNATIQLGKWTGGEAENAGTLDALIQEPTAGTLLAQIQTIADVIGDANGGLIRDYNRIAQDLATLVNALHDDGRTLENSPDYDQLGNATFFDNNSTANDAIGTITARNIQLNSAIAANPNLLAASNADGSPNNGANALAIGALRTSIAGANMGGLTFSQYYLRAVTSVGNDINNANSQVTAHKLLNEQLSRLRDSFAGVDVDEETVNLLKFQHAFEASAMLINTVNDMMRAILQMPR